MLVKPPCGIAAHRGFTLIEALVVLTIAGVLLAIGAPNLSFLIASLNARSASFDLVADLALARSEAIKRNQPITVEPLVTGNWSQGWRIVSGTTTLREHTALPSLLSVTSGAGSLEFQSNGRVRVESDTDFANNLSWAITSSSATPRCVVITPTGAARSKAGAC
jgi:type IV fimbrial biogenesis protein FimT